MGGAVPSSGSRKAKHRGAAERSREETEGEEGPRGAEPGQSEKREGNADARPTPPGGGKAGTTTATPPAGCVGRAQPRPTPPLACSIHSLAVDAGTPALAGAGETDSPFGGGCVRLWFVVESCETSSASRPRFAGGTPLGNVRCGELEGSRVFVSRGGAAVVVLEWLVLWSRRTVGRFVVNCVDDAGFDAWVAGWNWHPG
jgi:hypothetical protein